MTTTSRIPLTKSAVILWAAGVLRAATPAVSGNLVDTVGFEGQLFAPDSAIRQRN